MDHESLSGDDEDNRGNHKDTSGYQEIITVVMKNLKVFTRLTSQLYIFLPFQTA